MKRRLSSLRCRVTRQKEKVRGPGRRCGGGIPLCLPLLVRVPLAPDLYDLRRDWMHRAF